MALVKGVIDPNKHDPDEMFIGWDRAPKADRRFLLKSLPALTAAIGIGSYALTSNLSDPGAGSWQTGKLHQVKGYMVAAPYPMIRVPDVKNPGRIQTTLVVAEGKCTSGLQLDPVNGKAITASGVLIERKGRRMLEVPLLLDDWIAPAPALNISPPPAPRIEKLGKARLRGTIMDSKCFFGVMRPGRGRTHKACATLCIRGGIPPSFWARTSDGNEAVLLMTNADGSAVGHDILPLVADAVEVEGEIVRVDDIFQFRANADAYMRI